jgi:carboxypeptidase PM20D1
MGSTDRHGRPRMLLALFCLTLLTFSTGARAQTTERGPATGTPPGIDMSAAAMHLARAIQIRTVSYDDRDAASPATLTAFRQFLEQTYPAAHKALTREILDHQALLFTWQGTDPAAQPIILISHMDVVPAEEQGDAPWSVPAFSGAIRDGSVWGRGSIDMKGQLIGIFEAVEALTRSGFRPTRTVYIGLGSNEETSGSGAKAIARRLQTLGVRAQFILDEGPVVLDPFELTHKRAAFIGVAEKGYGTLLVRAADAGGHSAVPSSDPALERLARAIHAIDTMPIKRDLDPLDIVLLKSVAGDVGGFTKFAVNNRWLFKGIIVSRLVKIPAGSALLGTTIAPTMAAGSTKENEMPAIATARINVRLHPRDTADDILNEARSAVRKIRQVTVAWEAPPEAASRTASISSATYRLLVQQIRHMAGTELPVLPVLLPGQTDSRSYSAVADDAYLFQPYILTEAEAGEVHGRDEHLSLANVARAVRFFYDFIPEAASIGNPR